MVTLTEHATLLKNGDKISLYPTFLDVLIIIIKIMMMIILTYSTRVNLSAKLKLFSKGVLDN